jgi:site-specific DNA-cytosine methylase
MERRGFLDAVFEDYRGHLKEQLRKLGYETDWRLLNASEFGVSQLRPRVVIVAVKTGLTDKFKWPQVATQNPPTENGFLVLEAKNADAALKLLEDRPDVKLLFTDVQMPGSLNGSVANLAGGGIPGIWTPVG